LCVGYSSQFGRVSISLSDKSDFETQVKIYISKSSCKIYMKTFLYQIKVTIINL